MSVFKQQGIVYAYSKGDSVAEQAKDVLLEQKLNTFLLTVDWFLEWLWLFRDHAAYLDCGFARAWDLFGNHVSKNYLGIHPSMAKGGASPESVFSADEVRSARELFQQMIDVSAPIEDHVLANDYSRAVVNSPEVPRVIRCFVEVKSARVTNSIAHKISLYVTALETLFSTSSSELTYRLSERTACFLGDSAAERKEIFRFMKEAYMIRSAVVHGANLGKRARSLEHLSNISDTCDNLIRRCLLKILSERRLIETFTSDNEVIDGFFTDLIFD